MSTKERNALLRFFTENRYSPESVLTISKAFRGKPDQEKEKIASIILSLICNCDKADEAIRVLREKGILQRGDR